MALTWRCTIYRERDVAAPSLSRAKPVCATSHMVTRLIDRALKWLALTMSENEIRALSVGKALTKGFNARN